jgi:uncharacterized membrane protein YeaQ/YmgE (transglycosylase-associated protein family)
MSILGWIILGALAGWIASALTGAREGLLTNIVIGIVGAAIGGAVTAWAGHGGVTGLNLWSLCVAVVGAVILILVVRALRGRA